MIPEAHAAQNEVNILDDTASELTSQLDTFVDNKVTKILTKWEE